MKNIRILDCTLRDGGRIINCAFPNQEINELSEKLANAKIDIIEIGFLRDHRNTTYEGNSTFFTDVDQIRPFIHKENHNTMYVAFIDYGMFDFDSLKPYDGTSIDGIRFGFTRKDYLEHCDDILRCINIIKEKGYKLFIQGVNSLSYSDKELLELVELVNNVHPYSFGIVDTYGAMYIDDIDRIYALIDNNMDKDICINFHSHNNYQLSFAFAQEIIKLSHGVRQIIIDSTLAGMGKVAGNLNTELIVDFLVRKMHYNYEFEDILDIIDDYIYKYAEKFKWGYSIPAMMAGIYQSHPNNIIYLTEKFRLETKDISNLLSMISPSSRQRYNYDLIQKLYTEYIADKVDDYETINNLKLKFEGKDVLVLAPGKTLNSHHNEINNFITKHSPLIITVNFISKDSESYAFFGNQKRYDRLKKELKNRNIIISSNIRSSYDSDIIINYHSLINRGYKFFENSTIMLLNLLKKICPKHIYIAGFDGFDSAIDTNYCDSSFQNDRHSKDFDTINKEISTMLHDITETLDTKCPITLITPSKYVK